MSMLQHHFGQDIVAASKLRHNLLVATKEEVFLFDFIKQAVVDQCSLGLLKDKKLPEFTLLENDVIIFSSNSHKYASSEGQLQCQGEYPKPHNKYVCYTSDKQQTILTINHLNDELTINDISISHECSSFIFYH